jgi:radical SAM superfamily enzyme with C-terminal helix-hairpin-helix motif
MPAEALIIDGYVDEPACLGVAPYIAPYIRNIAGVLREHGREVRYLTIDQIRGDPHLLKSSGNGGLVVMVAGVTVPGKYFGGSPATLTEIQQLGTMLRGRERLLCGPIGYGYAPQGGSSSPAPRPKPSTVTCRRVRHTGHPTTGNRTPGASPAPASFGSTRTIPGS